MKKATGQTSDSQPNVGSQTIRRRILVVEDQRDIADMLVFNLQRAGYEASAVHDGRTALRQIEQSPPDLLLLDVMLPELSGTELASRLRSAPATNALPIIMVTAKAEEIDQLVGLTVGADDYITKPFSISVLLARIEAVLRRAAGAAAAAAGVGSATAPENILRRGELEVNLDTHQARLRNEVLRLTLTEFRLLSALLGAEGRVLSRSHLISKVMGPGIMVTERTIDVHMTALRKKLGDHGGIIETVRGVGYRVGQESEPSRV